jgi:hypothetical protein
MGKSLVIEEIKNGQLTPSTIDPAKGGKVEMNTPPAAVTSHRRPPPAAATTTTAELETVVGCWLSVIGGCSPVSESATDTNLLYTKRSGG